jgi:hypothetical protein
VDPENSEREGGAGAVPAFAVLLAGLAAVTYSTFLLEHFLSPDLDLVNGYVSELSAVDQPFHLIYSGGDFITGVLTIIVAGTALRMMLIAAGEPSTSPDDSAGPGLRALGLAGGPSSLSASGVLRPSVRPSSLRRRPWAVTGWIMLGMFGLSAIGDAVFPLDCAPSLESRCALLERSGKVSFSHEFHAFTSSMVVAFGVAALLALSVAARRYGWWPALARWGWPLAIAETALATGTMLTMVLGRWLGIFQRFQIGVLVLGLLTITWALIQERRATRRGAAASGTEGAPPR